MVRLLITALAPFVVLATSVAADSYNRRHSSLPSLSITKYIDPYGDYCPVERDRRRITHLTNKANRVNATSNLVEPAGESINIQLNDTSLFYIAKIGVGIPTTYHNLLVDTGSSNTWIGAIDPYIRTNTSVGTSELVGVKYGSALFTGRLYNDTVTIAPGITVSEQPIGVAINISGISPGVDGILGIGPSDLTFGTLYPDNTSTIPTITDSLFAQGTIKKNLIAVSFEPSASESTINGELTFGTTDSTKYIGNISYFPISNSSVASKYWGIDAAFQYGGANGSDPIGLSNVTAGFVDTGSTLLYLHSDAYDQYVEVTGGVFDNTTQLLRITEAQYESLQSLNIVIGGETFEMTRNAQIWPRALNTAILGEEDAIYLIVVDIAQTYPGLDFVFGMAFLERFYSVFDTGNRRIGLARTQFTNATTN